MDIKALIQQVGPVVGYILLFVIIFAESGLFIGFFLPGDSVLFTAGFLASQNILSLPLLIAICFVAAVLGDNVGYTFGRRVGRRFFQRDDSFLFKKKNLIRAQEFYDKNGPFTVVVARFVPVVRTFAPIVAGIGEMNYRKFLTFNLLGGVLWAIGLNLAGYFLGKAIPDVDKYLLPIIALIVIASVMPGVIHLLRDAEVRQGLRDSARRITSRGSAETKVD